MRGLKNYIISYNLPPFLRFSIFFNEKKNITYFYISSFLAIYLSYSSNKGVFCHIMVVGNLINLASFPF